MLQGEQVSELSTFLLGTSAKASGSIQSKAAAKWSPGQLLMPSVSHPRTLHGSQGGHATASSSGRYSYHQPHVSSLTAEERERQQLNDAKERNRLADELIAEEEEEARRREKKKVVALGLGGSIVVVVEAKRRYIVATDGSGALHEAFARHRLLPKEQLLNFLVNRLRRRLAALWL